MSELMRECFIVSDAGSDNNGVVSARPSAAASGRIDVVDVKLVLREADLIIEVGRIRTSRVEQILGVGIVCRVVDRYGPQPDAALHRVVELIGAHDVVVGLGLSLGRHEP